MILPPLNLLLADDDIDDCYLFREAVAAISQSAQISTIHDGAHLMSRLNQANCHLPDILFLDINMPRKNGFECLTEIKANDKLAKLPVIIYSTSLDPTMVTLFYEKGAKYYIQKPAEYNNLISIINTALTLTIQSAGTAILPDQFIITPQTVIK
jgi:DNA-binding NarL/FixJ family response regulator